jgi:signal peptidase II
MIFANKRLIPIYVGIIALILDITSKHLTHAYLPLIQYNWTSYPYGGIGVFKDFLGIEFSISHQINRGAAWGAFSEFQIYLLYLRIALVVGLLTYAAGFNKKTSWNIPLAMIIAGATGNVLDYFVYGHVVDMLHFVLWRYDFPVFNIADSSIFIGICWLLLISGRQTEPIGQL